MWPTAQGANAAQAHGAKVGFGLERESDRGRWGKAGSRWGRRAHTTMRNQKFCRNSQHLPHVSYASARRRSRHVRRRAPRCGEVTLFRKPLEMHWSVYIFQGALANADTPTRFARFCKSCNLALARRARPRIAARGQGASIRISWEVCEELSETCISHGRCANSAPRLRLPAPAPHRTLPTTARAAENAPPLLFPISPKAGSEEI